ncbi:MAG TPA: aminotransferase class V-fold PLP-dependent enzyme [Pyrinomonadaceae bacterium]|nr:aminotransferase class V-fold PLP-dependent enzyme [Pyrinomonadaceae bacterium]
MIYFDNNATTQIAPEVFEAMKPVLQEFYGNPSSAHTFGCEVRDIVEKSREKVASFIGANHSNEIIFTSGGTESDNWAIRGTLEANPHKKHIITTRVEHEAVRKLCEELQCNYKVTWLEVDEQGFLDLDELKKSLREDTVIVSVMTANNETGILFPIIEIAEIVKANSDAIFHTDAVNAVGKIPINLKETQIDLLSLSGHKFHAPKGIGALYVRENIKLLPFFIGGGQEKSRRAGTEAVHQIVGLGKAAEILSELPAVAGDLTSPNRIYNLRNKLEDFILQNIPNTTLNGTTDRKFRLPNTSNIAFPNINGEAILARLNDLEICVSTGSACNSETHTASPVMQAMNIPYSTAMGAIRFSLGRYNTEAEVDFVLENLSEIIIDLQKLSI